MRDRYQVFAGTRVGRFAVNKLGLPHPTPLERYHAGDRLVTGTVLTGAASGGRLDDSISKGLDSLSISSYATAPPGQPHKGIVFDGTGIASSGDLQALRRFFGPVLRSLSSCGRIVVIGTLPVPSLPESEQIAQRALEGFTRSLAKEVGHGSTVQLVYVNAGHEEEITSTLGFLLSPKSAYVSGQVIRIGGFDTPASGQVNDWTKPLVGKVALVTGAARGIGAAIARVLARDGATVVGVDVPAAGCTLAELINELGGEAVSLDIAGIDAPERITHHARVHHDGIDIVVYNAGITRDKRLVNMKEDAWRSTITVNLTAPERITTELLAQDLVRDNGRIVCVSSVSGIAGNNGQTNYATSKAGLIGLVEAFAPRVSDRGITVNAVAPGFIETQMTGQLPLVIREAGRRMNSLAQGGQPVDVAEAIAWFANPASTGVTGNVLRVCGQSLLGA
jgi:3-oxoacyl-[acyl-carrier protein] reductase